MELEPAITTTRKVAAMATGNLQETSLIADVLKSHPEGKDILRRHFGEKFLKQKSARILSLSMACILRRISLARLMDELWRLLSEKGANPV